jgi:hypothetical protein
MNDFQLIEKLASDLVELNNVTGINLNTWANAKEFVSRFYRGEDEIVDGDW